MSVNYNNIPEELRSLDFWCLWKMEDIGAAKPSKVPYSAKSKRALDINDTNNFASFQEAFNVFSLGGYSGLGFVFHDSHEYSFIDLDDTNGNQEAYDRQLKIYREFDSYSELSPSGKGVHVIVKGKVPSGRRRSYIEIYSHQRYATMTGNVHNAKPIENRQNLLTQLWEQMGGAINNVTFTGEDKEKYTDDEIIRTALNAANGDKFDRLRLGNWQADYGSQSEADFAFVDIIAFYSKNKNQIARIFRSSQLGARDKAKRQDYVDAMVKRSFDRMAPPIDFEGFKNAAEDAIAAKKKVTKPGIGSGIVPLPHKIEFSLPPGLLGEIAQFIYSAAPRQVPEVALAGAIGLMAGITGRAYNVSGTGLNTYVLLIAKTGIGKEAIASGIDKIMNKVTVGVVNAKEFIGPAEIASGQALVKYLNKTSQCFVSILGEFGLRLQSMSNQNANSAEISLRRMLLDLYNKSGHGQTFRNSIYADADKNTENTSSPSFSILGESTPERFYGALSEEMISEGLLPRFLIIEYNGERPHSNKQHTNAQPSFDLINKVETLCANCLSIMRMKKVINIRATDEAAKLLDDFDVYATNRINGTGNEINRELWNRAHMKVLRLAGLIAVGVNYVDPVIEPANVVWAINMVQSDIISLSRKFEVGEIGVSTSEIKQSNDVIKVIKDYFNRPWAEVAKYGQQNKVLYDNRIVQYAYINKRLVGMASFRNDKMGSSFAIKKAIQALVDTDVLREIGRNDMMTKYGTTQKAYVVSNLSILD